ncbi:hypothetical protein ERX46_15420 [Brumimicrobium glaciale]|uniref:Uncharacterized protein n=1 Tax=Brumimicrobium glaciale TaxID=200475 RepID=A0A4Q4KG22_9FLAO|nr:hypothetical protein [Brumimicrobium glaciale]RYM32071.1 hypothetical protein ERX46_15420 [Brumimicrobium glaciale]
MEALRKTVIIGCLIYGLYGLVSLFDLGTFIPPIPIKPFVFAAFLIAYVSVSRQDYSPLLRIGLLIWMMTLIFVGQYFVEIFFDYDMVDFYVNNVEPFVLMGSVAAFIAMTYKLVGELGYRSIKYYLPIVISAALIPLTIIFKDQIVFDWGMVIVAFFFFVFERTNKAVVTDDKYEKIFYVLNGVAVITIIERITYLL